MQAKLHLEADGLVLWQALLYHTESLKPELADLLSVAIGLLASDPESMVTYLSIIDSYVLIDAPAVYRVRSTFSTAASQKICTLIRFKPLGLCTAASRCRQVIPRRFKDGGDHRREHLPSIPNSCTG